MYVPLRVHVDMFILLCIWQRGFGVISPDMTSLHDRVDALECHLSAAEILEKHDIAPPIDVIRQTQV